MEIIQIKRLITKLILAHLLFLSVPLSSQEIINIKGSKGTALIYGDLSPNKAKTNALNDAKLNALKLAGIKENISSYELLFKSQLKNDFSEFFTSDIQTEIQGAIQKYEIIKEHIYCRNESEIIYDIIIDASVIKYDSKSDLSFTANIQDIKSLYNNDDVLSFKVKISQPSYLTIFCINDNESSLLYPNTYEKQLILKPFEFISFPFSDISYNVHTNLKTQETNRLIFVFTKKCIPYIKTDLNQNTSQENIFFWIYSIPPDQRTIEYFTFTIQN